MSQSKNCSRTWPQLWSLLEASASGLQGLVVFYFKVRQASQSAKPERLAFDLDRHARFCNTVPIYPSTEHPYACMLVYEQFRMSLSCSQQKTGFCVVLSF